MAALTWELGNDLVAKLGSERHLTGREGRIYQERTARGWTQQKLAEEMKRVDCPIQQSALSKLEKKGDRGVTIDELVALSKVFGIPVGELLLPPDVLNVVQGMKDLADGPQQFLTAYNSRTQYERLLTRVVDFAAQRPAVVEEHVFALYDKHQDALDPRDSAEFCFAEDVMARLELTRRSQEK